MLVLTPPKVPPQEPCSAHTMNVDTTPLPSAGLILSLSLVLALHRLFLAPYPHFSSLSSLFFPSPLLPCRCWQSGFSWTRSRRR